jgi:hypothetical protein
MANCIGENARFASLMSSGNSKKENEKIFSHSTKPTSVTHKKWLSRYSVVQKKGTRKEHAACNVTTDTV